MKFLSLELEKFKSVRQKQRLDFSNQGLYFVVGQNQIENRLGANGSGKTTWFESLVWCLYGRTPRGLRAENICSWGEKGGTKVSVRLDMHGSEWYIERSWKPNSLLLVENKGAERQIEQQELDRLLGMSFEAFTNSVYIGQFARVFFDLSSSEKLSVFSELMSLNYWLECSNKASADYGTNEVELNQISKKVAQLQGGIDALVNEIKVQTAASEEFKQAKLNRLKDLKSQQLKYKESLDTYTKDKDKSLTALTALQKQLLTVSKEEEDLIVSRRTADHDLHELSHQKRMLDSTYNQVLGEIKKVKSFSGTCPHCAQEITKDHINREIARLDKDRKDCLATMAEAEAIYKQLQEEYDGYTEKLKAIAITIASDRRKESTLVKCINECERLIAASEANFNQIEIQIKEQQKITNTHEKRVQSLEKEKAGLESQYNELEKELKEKQRYGHALSYWKSAFKQIRLFLIEESLAFLEVEVNNTLAGLGLQGWKIKFDVEKENKTGGVSKGFHVMIFAPNSKTGVPWEAWSGGETQRLRLAGVFGLAGLIANRYGVHSNLMVLDEPTNHLDDEGISDLLDFLATRSAMDKRQIWLIDHRSHAFGRFAGVVEVVKDENGSKLHWR